MLGGIGKQCGESVESGDYCPIVIFLLLQSSPHCLCIAVDSYCALHEADSFIAKQEKEWMDQWINILIINTDKQ